jgi:hypothetical protein
LIGLNRRLFPANVVVYEQFQHFWLLPCLKVAAELDLAWILKEGPMTLEEIAGRVNADPDALFRVMRALASQGFFRQLKDGRFANTRLSKPLADGQGSMRNMILHHLGKVNWNLMGNLSYSVRSGEEAFTDLFGKGIYEFLSGHPEESAIFERSMSNLTRLAIDPLLNACDFSVFPILADIGGGEGTLLATILTRHPGIQGVLMDLPGSAARAGEAIRSKGLADRIRIVEGDFFSDPPPVADGYMIKNVLHNWGDPECTRILRNINKSMPVSGTLLILEMIVEENNRPSFAKLIDIQMMVSMAGGRERTLREFMSLLESSGFRISRIIPTIAPLSVIECKKI